jgi:hypothetical protein
VPIRLYRPDRTTGGLGRRPALPIDIPPAGLRVGVVHNRKMNAGLLIGELAANLAKDVEGDVAYIDTKDTAQIPCPPEVLDRAAELCMLVFTGSGD